MKSPKHPPIVVKLLRNCTQTRYTPRQTDGISPASGQEMGHRVSGSNRSPQCDGWYGSWVSLGWPVTRLQLLEGLW